MGSDVDFMVFSEVGIIFKCNANNKVYKRKRGRGGREGGGVKCLLMFS